MIKNDIEKIKDERKVIRNDKDDEKDKDPIISNVDHCCAVEDLLL